MLDIPYYYTNIQVTGLCFLKPLLDAEIYLENLTKNPQNEGEFISEYFARFGSRCHVCLYNLKISEEQWQDDETLSRCMAIKICQKKSAFRLIV